MIKESLGIWYTSIYFLILVFSVTPVAAHVGCLAVSAGSRDSGREKAEAEDEEQNLHHFLNNDGVMCSLVSGQDAIDDSLSWCLLCSPRYKPD